MIQDDVLINDWHVVARSEDVPEGELLAVKLLDEDIVLWRAKAKPLPGRTSASTGAPACRSEKLKMNC